MHIHNVYFWLHEGLDASDVTAFENGLASLCGDEAVQSGWYGKPAQTDRDVVENSYSYGLVLVFENLDAHDQYQGGDIHLQFVDDHLAKWNRVVVHDVETL